MSQIAAKQTIDLYRDDLRPLQSSGALQQHALIGAGILLLMLAWGGLTQWQANAAADRLAELVVQQQSLQQRTTAASEALARRVPDAAITAALVQAQFALDGRLWLVDQLQQGADEVVPFSAVLEGLGRQRPPPLWLTGIHIGAAGADLGLSGRTLDADAVPRFLQALSAEPALAGRGFTHFTVARPEAAGLPLEFEMATGCAALADGCEGDDSREVTR